jgi:tRNA threonylcarbamoyladenosine biosynthesis protein TsaE
LKHLGEAGTTISMQAYTSNFKMTMTFQLRDVGATQRLAAALADICAVGDIIALHGDLGAGKTCFSRFFVHALGVEEEVPSPTFTLVQTYPLANHSAEAIWHFDLYRIGNPAEAYELDIEDAFDTGISLIEWPENLGELMPEQHLQIKLAFAEDEGARTATLEVPRDWVERMATVTSALSDLLE